MQTVQFNPDTDEIAVTNVADTVWPIPEGAAQILLQSRNANPILVAYKAGRIAAGRYVTIQGSAAKTLNDIWATPGQSIYLRSGAAANDVVEVEWTER